MCKMIEEAEKVYIILHYVQRAETKISQPSLHIFNESLVTHKNKNTLPISTCSTTSQKTGSPDSSSDPWLSRSYDMVKNFNSTVDEFISLFFPQKVIYVLYIRLLQQFERNNHQIRCRIHVATP